MPTGGKATAKGDPLLEVGWRKQRVEVLKKGDFRRIGERVRRMDWAGREG
jgi:hypothetical protein